MKPVDRRMALRANKRSRLAAVVGDRPSPPTLADGPSSACSLSSPSCTAQQHSMLAGWQQQQLQASMAAGHQSVQDAQLALAVLQHRGVQGTARKERTWRDSM